jgi:predicted nicotinamide N-methyase
VAIAASQLNAQINGVELNFCTENLIGSDCADYDLILVGDMLYDSALSDIIAYWLMKLRLAKKMILVGDPGRGPVGSSTVFANSLCHLAKYELDPFTKRDNYGFLQSHVFTLL